MTRPTRCARGWLVLGVLAMVGCAATTNEAPNATLPLERYSLMGAIKNGYLNGTVDVGTVRKHGSFGLGGFESFSGEMVMLDGVVYRVPVDGVPVVARDADQLTYAELTQFRPTVKTVETALDKKALLQKLTVKLANPNQFYSIKITGTFSKLKYRTLVEQAPPYSRPICAKQIDRTFEAAHVQGTIVGFLSPSFVKGGIDYPGSHLHVLSADRRLGGHIYDFEVASATVEIASHDVFITHLPVVPSFGALVMDETLICPEQN